MLLPDSHHEDCPACGGSGGGPFGRAGSAWDVETYLCPRCEGLGYLLELPLALEEGTPSAPRPGIAKTVPPPAPDRQNKRRNAAG